MPLLCRRSVFLTAILVSCWLFTSPASACSMCRCGDSTFNALGIDVYQDGAFRVALDWERFDKTQGMFMEMADGGMAEGREAMVESRLTTTLSYSFRGRLIAVARVPFSSRNMDMMEMGNGLKSAAVMDRMSGNGLADPELYALVRLWSSGFSAGTGRRAWLSALGGVKTDWGHNDLADAGGRMSEHMQPGTGSIDWFGGLSGAYLLDARSSLFASAQYRGTGANRFGYEYGDVLMASAGYERKLGRVWDAALELDYRDAGRDRMDRGGMQDPSTGGALLYVAPKLILDLHKGLAGRFSVQIPMADGLNGDQEERPVANMGLTYLF